MDNLTYTLPVNVTATDINTVGLLALMKGKTIIHTVETENEIALELHTHNRLSQNLLDVRIKLPLGDLSTNVTPSLFEDMVNGCGSKSVLKIDDSMDKDILFDITNCESTTIPTSREDNVYRNPLIDELVQTVSYTSFIIREECVVEKHHGQMLPWRYVQVVWAYEDGISYEEQIAEFEGVKIEAFNDDVVEFIKVNSTMLEEYLTEVTTMVREEMSQELDIIALDSDYPNLETDVGQDMLLAAMSNFYSARDQLPNNPFFLHMPPRSMSADELAIYNICYNENTDRYNPACSISPEASDPDFQPDAETLEFVKERMKARIGIYHPDDIPDGVDGVWGDDIVRSHRGTIFIPYQHFNMPFMENVLGGVEKRITEMDSFFEELVDG